MYEQMIRRGNTQPRAMGQNMYEREIIVRRPPSLQMKNDYFIPRLNTSLLKGVRLQVLNYKVSSLHCYDMEKEIDSFWIRSVKIVLLPEVTANSVPTYFAGLFKVSVL